MGRVEGGRSGAVQLITISFHSSRNNFSKCFLNIGMSRNDISSFSLRRTIISYFFIKLKTDLRIILRITTLYLIEALYLTGMRPETERDEANPKPVYRVYHAGRPVYITFGVT